MKVYHGVAEDTSWAFGFGAGFCQRKKQVLAAGLSIVLMGAATACGGNTGGGVPQQSAPAVESPKQEEALVVQTPPQTENAGQQAAGEEKSVQNGGQISLDEAKAAAIADAGVSAEVTYTKEKLDYEDGISVYEIEFFADNVEYEYEINAETGAVYSKSMETRHGRGHGHQAAAGEMATDTSQSFIDADTAVAAALQHAGFSDTDVTIVKKEFDFDDGRAEYEIEFFSGGREYEYKISAEDGSVLEYEVD